ncbi:hypothetical protein Tco_1270317 [Tanacetum coccineum]
MIQQCKVQEIQSSVTGSGDETSSGIVSDEEIDKQGFEAHYGFMAKIQEVLLAESSSTDTPLEQVQNNDEKNVFANERQHSKKNSTECTDERVALANLIANLTLDLRKQTIIKSINSQIIKHDELVKESFKQITTGRFSQRETQRSFGYLQSIQTIHMLAPKCATYNGRLTFANPRYLKKAQSEKPRLYEIPYDTSDPANRFAPDREETMTLDNESRSKLNKDYFRTLKGSKEYNVEKTRLLEQNHKLAKNVAFLPVSESISKSRQVFNDMTFNINQFIEIVDQTWRKHTSSCFRVPTAHDMELLIKTLLMPLSIKSQNDSFRFEHELKTEMHEDFEYVKSLEKEIDELESEKANFSNIYDLLLEEWKSGKLFDKPSVVRQPNAQRIPKNHHFKQVTQQNFPQIRKQAVRNTNVIAPDPSRNNPKHVSFQSPKEIVGSNDMVHNYYLEKGKKSAQLQKDKDVNGKPSMIDPARLSNTANGCKPNLGIASINE